MEHLKKFIRDIQDFPSKGILFKDITPLLANPQAFEEVIDILSEKVKYCNKIIWLDARWFIFAAAVAYKLYKPLILIRKKGKLPFDTIDIDYELEYGNASFSIHTDSIIEGDKVAIIDDSLATWWTAYAATQLVEKLKGTVHSLNFLIELNWLNWKDKLKKYKINKIFNY